MLVHEHVQWQWQKERRDQSQKVLAATSLCDCEECDGAWTHKRLWRILMHNDGHGMAPSQRGLTERFVELLNGEATEGVRGTWRKNAGRMTNDDKHTGRQQPGGSAGHLTTEMQKEEMQLRRVVKRRRNH